MTFGQRIAQKRKELGLSQEKGTEREEPGWYRRQEVTLDPGCKYCEAAVYTDKYGRRRIYSGAGIAWEDEHWGYSSPYVDGLEDCEF